MFTAIITTVLNSFAEIFWKKWLKYRLSTRNYDLSGFFAGLLILLVLLVLWIDASKIDLFAIAIVTILFFLYTFNNIFRQKLLREEKISFLIPYSNINKVIMIILWFIIFRDSSLITVLIWIFVILILVISSIDLKTFKISKKLWNILTIQVIDWLAWVLWWWFIVMYSDKLYFALYVIIGLVLLSLINIKTWEIKELVSAPKWFWKDRVLSSTWWLWWFLSLVLISNLWITTSVLLSFLWIWTTLLFSYMFLRDKPVKKDIILTIVVMILIWLWYYLK